MFRDIRPAPSWDTLSRVLVKRCRLEMEESNLLKKTVNYSTPNKGQRGVAMVSLSLDRGIPPPSVLGGRVVVVAHGGKPRLLIIKRHIIVSAFTIKLRHGSRIWEKVSSFWRPLVV